MKLFTKTLLATGLLTAASAQAATVSLTVYDDADAGYTSFNTSLFKTVAYEDFNGLGDGQILDHNGDGKTEHQDSWEARSSSFSTNVGTFTLNEAGQSGDNYFRDELMIESNVTGEFGREELADDFASEEVASEKDFWLDSNDAKKVTWEFGDFVDPESESFNAIGFFLADAVDQGAKLTLKFDDGTEDIIDLDSLATEDNANLKFVSITSDMNINGGSLIFDNSTGSDGWGIDKVTLGKLPEPGTLLLMGLGLLGLGAARRRAAK